MKMFVFSDTHGSIQRAVEVVKKSKENSEEPVDLLVHLGDMEYDAEQLEKLTGIRCVHVRGNMDGAMRAEDSRYLLDTEYGKIYLTHGHGDGVNYGMERLVYRAEELECKAAFFGHTHRAFLDQTEDGIYVMNPGSISNPRDGSGGSYGIVRTYPDRMECTIMYYQKGGKNKPASRGGYLRNLLNNSDRF